MKKIIVLSLALVAGLFMVSNVTNAQTAQLDLEITAVNGYCVYGANLDLWSGAQSYSAFNMTGYFHTLSGNATWLCNDTAGKGPWTLTVQASDLVIGAYSIDKSLIEMKAGTSYVTENKWDPAVFSGNNTDMATWASIGSTKIVLQKTSAAGTVGELATDNVELRVLVPANQEIWKYKATITITVPPMTV